MLPPGAEIVGFFSWLFSFIPYVGAVTRKFLISKFGGYFLFWST